MKTLLLMIAALMVAGCMTTYDIQACNPETGTCTSVVVKSFREFEQPNVEYMRTEDGVTFSFGAKAASTGASPVEQAFGDAIRAGAVTLAPAIVPNDQD